MSIPPTGVSDPHILAGMRRWLERAVIGLNLCPFAKSVHVRGQVHWVVSHAASSRALEDELLHELRSLVATDPAERDTTMLVVPQGLDDFFEFNRFLADTTRLLKRHALAGVLQIASFHPEFQFAGTSPDDVTNCSNRAPYPTLHLLREASIDRAVRSFPDAEMIYGNNIRTLEQLGMAGWRRLGAGRSDRDDGDGR